MIHSRLIRTAVNFSLIIALAMQQNIAFAAMASCLTGCKTGFNCQGCGCCEVDRMTTLCGCCGVEEAESQGSSDTQASCCRHDDDAIADATFVDSDCELKESRTVISAVAVGSGEKSCGLGSLCPCVQKTQPLGEPSPRRASTEDRNQTSTCCPISTTMDVDNQADPSVVTRTVSVPSLEHFSQVMLCIWRL